MSTQAIKVFRTVVDNSKEISNEIRSEIYKLLGVNSKDEKLEEYIKECLESFRFNIIERNLLGSISSIIDEELKKLQSNSNREINFSAISDNLIKRLKDLKTTDIPFDDDLRTLSVQIARKFPEAGFTSEQLYEHFMSKKEPMISMVESYNQNILDTLIKFSPQLLEEMENIQKGAQISNETPNRVPNNNDTNTPNNTSQATDGNRIQQDIELELENIIREIDTQWQELSNYSISGEKSKIASIRRQVQSLLDSLKNGTVKLDEGVDAVTFIKSQIPNMGELSRIMTNNASSINEAKDEINNFIRFTHVTVLQSTSMTELLRMKKEIEFYITKYPYNTELKSELSAVLDRIVNLSIRKSDDIPTPPSLNATSEIGSTTDGIAELISTGAYFSVLESITKNNINNYREFINAGFRRTMATWYKKAEQAKTNEERLEAYNELKTIYDEFQDYMQSERGYLESLEVTFKQMEEYFGSIEKNASTIPDDVRYTSSGQDISAENKRQSF